MEQKYSDELLSLGFSTEVLDGSKVERQFFAITEDDLENVFHVSRTDSVIEAKKKINEVVSQDDFLYKYFHKDPLVWELREYTPGYWTTPVKTDKIYRKEELYALGYSEAEVSKMKLPVKYSDVKNIQQQKLTIRFVKRQPMNAMDDDSLNALFEKYDREFKEFLAHEDVYTKLLRDKVSEPVVRSKSNKKLYDTSKLLVIPDVELHIGKLASKFDSTDSYDYKKALYRYTKIISEAEKVQKMYNAGSICMTIGNDFFNTDTEQNTTTAGTEQHNDTRFQQMIATGIVAHVWAIEKTKKTCNKVILKYNPGNHDYLTDYTLFMQLYMLYKDDPKVSVECKVKDSRWATALNWESNLIIFAHGKTPEGRALNDDSLALLPNTTFTEEAKQAKHSTVIAGHLHNATENNFSSKKRASNGVTVLRGGSPCGDGAWDSGNLYSSDKSHQVYVFDAENGLYSTINIKLSKEDLEKGIVMPTITDDTNYLETTSCAIERGANDVLLDSLREQYDRNESQIRTIRAKYTKLFNRLYSSLEGVNFTEEQKAEIYKTLGYDAEIEPYFIRRDELTAEMSKLNGEIRKQLTKN